MVSNSVFIIDQHAKLYIYYDYDSERDSGADK